MKIEDKSDTPKSTDASQQPVAPATPPPRRRRLASSQGNPAWGNVLQNLEAGSEDGIRNALMLISRWGLTAGPALARLQAPRPSAMSSDAAKRLEVERMLRDARLEAERLATRRAGSPA